MNISIIGTGNVGTALGRAWASKGHRIWFGSRDPKSEKAGLLSASIGSASVVSDAAALQSGDVIVLASVWDAARDLLAKNSGLIADKIIIDATNPLRREGGKLSLAIGYSSSGGEQIAAAAKGAHVYKSLNHTGFGNMADSTYPTLKPAMFVAGDNARHKPVVMALIEELGFDVVDAGGLDAARLLEPMAMLWIKLAMEQGLGRNMAFALTRRQL